MPGNIVVGTSLIQIVGTMAVATVLHALTNQSVDVILAMILMVMTMLLSAMGVVREKEIGTMEQLIVTPVRPWQLLLGKLTALLFRKLSECLLVGLVHVLGIEHFGHLAVAACRLPAARPQTSLHQTLSPPNQW